ncbi:MAG: hypothetical protein QOC66_86 [Pseudonocardiales bacterium]|jgi:uncharacterized protein with FMN-binding domain|nr:hypothetical protein [Pseudonocardiales bacterium]
MRRVALALFSTITGLVILLDFKTHSASTIPAAVSTAGPSTRTGTGSAATPAAGSTASSSSSSSGTKTVTGDSVDTQWGPVQVEITLSNGKVTKANAVVYPTQNPRDQEINAYAIPALNQEAVSAGSAQIDMISGATVTSTGYVGSLQSALDKAGL